MKPLAALFAFGALAMVVAGAPGVGFPLMLAAWACLGLLAATRGRGGGQVGQAPRATRAVPPPTAAEVRAYQEEADRVIRRELEAAGPATAEPPAPYARLVPVGSIWHGKGARDPRGRMKVEGWVADGDVLVEVVDAIPEEAAFIGRTMVMAPCTLLADFARE